jgi:methylated-DNA-[protein]-cysteine S-methyltransferase
MPNVELHDLEAALRRGADVEVTGAADAATRTALDHAARQGLVDVAVDTVESPLGDLLVAVTPRGLARVAYDPQRRMLDELSARIASRVVSLTSMVDPVRRQLDEYFDARRREFDIDLDYSLTSSFGESVLRAAVRIPVGEVATYGELAVRIGTPRGARAVGNALGANPIPIVVPCHRVVPSSGGLGKYTGGVWRKERLLGLEGATP